MQQPLPNNQDIQQSLEFMCTLHRIHLHHLLGQVIAADPQHKIQQSLGSIYDLLVINGCNFGRDESLHFHPCLR